MRLKRLDEELGKSKIRMFKGGGAGHSNYQWSTKASLGDKPEWGVPANPGYIEDKEVKRPVNISRAFKS